MKQLLRSRFPLSKVLRKSIDRLQVRRRRRDYLSASFAFGRATSPPSLAKQEAIRVAEERFLGAMPPKARIKAKYGRFKNLARERFVPQPDGHLQRESIPPFDAWLVTVKGVSLPRPSRGAGRRGPRPHGPDPVTTLLIVIDDKAAEVHEAIGF